ncbi:hypothetical protein ColTof4_01072 [Colletotrichum tofieldiae]|nr:hypothetical protein, variant [Colletotrichum tofieldiae]GKT68649.1 hypothetical protein ColTof4_01072 [Colletotrichum tofieldiae]
MALTPSPLFCAQAVSYRVGIFGTVATGIDMGEEAAQFFRKHLKIDVRLLFIGGDGQRSIPGPSSGSSATGALMTGSFFSEKKIQSLKIRFADAAPYLVTSTASEEEARSRLPSHKRSQDVIVRFRPNIHVGVDELTPPFDEDHWAKLAVYNASEKEAPKATWKLDSLHPETNNSTGY